MAIDERSMPLYQLEQRLELLKVLRVLGKHGDVGKDAAIIQAVAEDVPHGEIARELGLKVQTVRNRLCRIRRLAAGDDE